MLRNVPAAEKATGADGWAEDAWPVNETMVMQRGETDCSLERELQPGDLLCAIFDSPNDQLTAATSFIQDGLERGERALLLAERGLVDRVWAALPNWHPAALERRALLAVTNRDRVLRDWRFDPETVVSVIEQAADEARETGYAGLRACLDMTWGLRPAGEVTQVSQFAAALQRALASFSATALVLYDRVRFPQPMIEAALRAHPFVVRGERILANPYFVPADSRFGARQSVDRMLRHLDRLAVATADEPLLRHVLDALPHGVLFCDGAGVIRVINRPVAALLARPADSLVGAPLGSLFADGSPPSGWPRMNGSDLRRLRLRRGDGRVCWAAATAHQISAAGHLLVLLDTEPAGWHSVGVDAEARSDPLGRLIDPADERALPTRRFLVASSAPALAETLSMLLIADGHGVVVAASGEEAQRLVNSTPLDAVLIDLDDGSAAWGTQIRELRATCPRVPIVLITAWEASIDPALARDASALLIKPFSRRHLREALTSCLVRRPMQELGE